MQVYSNYKNEWNERAKELPDANKAFDKFIDEI